MGFLAHGGHSSSFYSMVVRGQFVESEEYTWSGSLGHAKETENGIMHTQQKQLQTGKIRLMMMGMVEAYTNIYIQSDGGLLSSQCGSCKI